MEKGKPVVIDQEKLAKMLERVPMAYEKRGRQFTAFEDAFILAVWKQRKNKRLAAKELGISEGSMRARYSVLTEDGK